MYIWIKILKAGNSKNKKSKTQTNKKAQQKNQYNNNNHNNPKINTTPKKKKNSNIKISQMLLNVKQNPMQFIIAILNLEVKQGED